MRLTGIEFAVSQALIIDASNAFKGKYNPAKAKGLVPKVRNRKVEAHMRACFDRLIEEEREKRRQAGMYQYRRAKEKARCQPTPTQTPTSEAPT